MRSPKTWIRNTSNTKYRIRRYPLYDASSSAVERTIFIGGFLDRGISGSVTRILPLSSTYANNLIVMIWRMLIIFSNQNCWWQLKSCKWNKSTAHDFSSRYSSPHVLSLQFVSRPLATVRLTSSRYSSPHVLSLQFASRPLAIVRLSLQNSGNTRVVDL